MKNCPAGRQAISSTVSSTFTRRKEESVEIESRPWTYQNSTSISSRQFIDENYKIFQEFHGDNPDKTLTIPAIRLPDIKRILLSIKTGQPAFQKGKMCHCTIQPHGGSTRILYCRHTRSRSWRSLKDIVGFK